MIKPFTSRSWPQPDLTGSLPVLDAHTLVQHQPAVHYQLIDSGHLIARCSVWVQATPLLEGQPIAIVGHYAASTLDGGVEVLKHAFEELKRRGFKVVVGPMDGNTWRRYRFITWRGEEPPFFLEPDNSDDWPSHFLAAGCSPLAHYSSAVNEDLSRTDPRVAGAMARFAADGVTIRTINLSRLDEELKAVHELSLEAFAENFLYTPITQAEFLGMYVPLRQHLNPELIFLAEQRGKLVGFIFGLPDLAQAQRGEPITTAIAKSMAVRPGRAGAGLGSILMERFHRAAHQMGFTRVIHALMHENNRSVKISSRSGRPIRHYTLYSKDLAS